MFRSGHGKTDQQKQKQQAAVLVTAPRCERQDSDGAVKIEPAHCETVDLTEKGNLVSRFLEANVFGVESWSSERTAKNDSTEMKDMTKVKVSSASPSSAARSSKHENVVGFDTCHEYSFSSDDDDDDDDDEHCAKDNGSYSAAGSVTTNGLIINGNNDNVLKTYILGKTYHPINDYAPRRDDESSLFWFTYRCDFPEISPYNITSDAGWGCMLRSAQMLLAQTVRAHYKGRSWRPPHSIARRRQDPFVRSVLTWFADFPSSTDCFYSLHNMVAAGIKYDRLPGEWYGPGAACLVVRDLVQMHERHQQQANSLGKEICHKMFRVYVASQGAIYRDAIENLVATEAKARMAEEKSKKKKESSPAHPLDVAWDEELIESIQGAAGEMEWDTSLLLLIPVRLGLKSFNEDYVKSVANTFSMPQSVGVLGGRPRSARWFYGASSDGEKIFGLDPHTVQHAPQRRTARVNGKPSSLVELSEDYVRSVHTTYSEVLSLQKMDPTIALGFYCRDRKDMEDLFASIQKWKDDHPNAPELFSIADTAPDYSSNAVSSAMNDMMLSSMSLQDFDDDQASDGDEFVML